MKKTDKRTLYIAGLITESQYYGEQSENNVESIINKFNELSSIAEEEFDDDETLDDYLRVIGVKFNFKGGDYVGESDIQHLDNNQLKKLDNVLNQLTIAHDNGDIQNGNDFKDIEKWMK